MSYSKLFIHPNQVSLFDYFHISDKPINKRIQEFVQAACIVQGDRKEYGVSFEDRPG